MHEVKEASFLSKLILLRRFYKPLDLYLGAISQCSSYGGIAGCGIILDRAMANFNFSKIYWYRTSYRISADDAFLQLGPDNRSIEHVRRLGNRAILSGLHQLPSATGRC